MTPAPSPGQRLRAARVESGSARRRSSASRRARYVTGWDDETRDVVVDRVRETTDAGRDDRPAVGHRLAGGDTVPLATRRDAHDGGPLVVRAELVVGHEPDGRGYEIAERPVPDDDERKASRGLGELGCPSPPRVARRRGRAVARRAPPTRPGRRRRSGSPRTSRAPSARVSAASADDAQTTILPVAAAAERATAAAWRARRQTPTAAGRAASASASRRDADGSQWACTTSASA